jgi:hypothetical protein
MVRTPGHRCPWVVLDSTVLGMHDRYLESAAGRQLVAESAAGRLHIVVPEVVVLESAAKHGRDARDAVSKMGAAQRTLYDL